MKKTAQILMAVVLVAGLAGSRQVVAAPGSAEAFAQMKPTAILVNCARGAVVVQAELERALREERLAAAGLDTLTDEPPGSNNPLLKLPNVIITPHCAAHTMEALSDVRQQAYAEVARALRGESLLQIVNQKYFVPRASPLAAVRG